MIRRGFIKTILLSTAVAALFTGAAYARDFTDVPKDFWGKDAIQEMSDKNIIVGYTDGTFKPNKEVKKVEVLITLARILGVNAQENTDMVAQAEENYRSVLQEYDTYASKEIAFLLQKKVVKLDELDMYLGNGNDGQPMLRKEIVPLLIRTLGKEDQVGDKNLVILSYKDAESIPGEIRAYVEYLGKENIMGTATEDNKFVPNGAITRAQIATLLSRILAKMDGVDLGDTTVSNENTDTTDTTQVQETVNQNIIQGPIKTVAIDLAGAKRSITVSVTLNGKVEDIQIPISKDAEIYIDGGKSRMTLIKEGDYAKVEINEAKEAVKIETEKKDKTVTGLISSVDNDKSVVSVDVDSKISTYKVASDVKIIKNAIDIGTNINKLSKGDTVILVLEYNVVKAIDAKSIQKQVEGIINEIIISKNPKLTLVDGKGKSTTYELNKNAVINLLDTKSEIYDLRLGNVARLSLDSSEAVMVEVFHRVIGLVDSVNPNFNEINIKDENGNLIQLLVNEKSKYFDVANKEVSISDIKAGQNVVVSGMQGKTSFYVKEMRVTE